MPIFTTLPSFKSHFQSAFTSVNSISSHMTQTQANQDQLGRKYAFSGPCWFLRCTSRMMEADQDTYWADFSKGIVDRMLFQRDDRAAARGEWDPTASFGGYSGYERAPRRYLSGQPLDNQAAPVWHRVQGGKQAQIVDNGIILTAMMQYVDAVMSFPVFSSYQAHANTVMDDVQTTINEWLLSGFSSWRYNFNGNNAVNGNIPGSMYWENPDTGGLFGGQPELNQQCQFLVAQLLLYKYRPANNPDVLNKVSAFINRWKDFIELINGDSYSWPYSLVNNTQSPGSAGGGATHSNRTSITGHTFTYKSEDNGHAVLTIELLYYAWRHFVNTGMDLGFNNTDADRVAKTFTSLMYRGNGTMSPLIHTGGDANHVDVYDYGAGTFCRFHTRDANLMTYARAVFDEEHPTTSNLYHKPYFQIGELLWGENPPGAPPQDTVEPTVTISTPADMADFDTDPNITMTGTASDADSGVQKVEVRVNSQSWLLATGTTSWSRGVTLAAGSNTLDARATDNATNVSAIDTHTVTYTPPDTTDPTVSITTPADSSTVDNAMQTMTGTAADDTAVENVQVRVNGGAWETATGTTSWTHEIVLTTGANTIEAQSFDFAGNSSTIDSHSVTLSVESTPPTISITSHSNGAMVSSGSITIEGTASDADSGVAYVEVRVDSTDEDDWILATGTTSWSVTLPIGGGIKSVEARAYDVAGNVSNPLSINVEFIARVSSIIRLGGA